MIVEKKAANSAADSLRRVIRGYPDTIVAKYTAALNKVIRLTQPGRVYTLTRRGLVNSSKLVSDLLA